MIRLATAEDLNRLPVTGVRAFVDDPVQRWLFPEDDDYTNNGASLFTYMSRRWQHTDSQWCTDDGVAFAGWVPPGRPEVPEEVLGSLGYVPDWRAERIGALVGVMAENTPPEDHWYLNILATHPDWQRQGLGAALMKVVFDIADEAGLPCYLETETIENVAYYRHHGFDIRSEWDVELKGPHMWGMLRPPLG